MFATTLFVEQARAHAGAAAVSRSAAAPILREEPPVRADLGE